MSKYHVTKCRSCKAPIIWTTSSKGRNQPVDAQPCDDGTLGLEPGGKGEAPRSVAFQPLVHTERYRSHFARCPHADRWRRRESDPT